MDNNKIKLFTDSDLDGVSCAVLAHIVFAVSNTIDVEFCTPKDINQKIADFIRTNEYENYKKIFITDLVIKEETGKMIDNVDGFKFKLFDHHRSNYVNAKYTWANVYENYNDRKTCGTELFWNHLKEYYISDDFNFPIIDKYVEYVTLWDTWAWTNAENDGLFARDLNTVMNMYSRTKFVNMMIKRIVEADNFISENEMEIIRIEEDRKRRYVVQKIKNVRIIKVRNYTIGYLFAENYISELGNYICKNIKDIDFVAIINADNSVVSLRATKNESEIDLAEIARSFNPQGGGHPLSAGFVYDKTLENSMIRGIFGDVEFK